MRFWQICKTVFANAAASFASRLESLLNPPVILVRRLSPDGGICLPKLQGDVGYDLIASEDVIIPPLPSLPTRVLTGVAIKIPKGYYCHFFDRSSVSKKMGLLLTIPTFDNGYTGVLDPWFWNMTSEPVKVEKGQRICQVVFFRSNVFPIKMVDELPKTVRGNRGFGSTGK